MNHVQDQRKPVEIRFSGDALEGLEKLKRETRAGTPTQVVLDALMVYSALLEISRYSNTIIVQDRGGKRIRLTLYPEKR